MSRREPQCGKEADKKRSRSPPVSSTLTFSSRIQHCRARRVCRSRKWPSFLLPFEKLPRVHPQLRLPYVEGGCNSRLRCHTEPEEENTVVVLALSVSFARVSLDVAQKRDGGRKGKEKKRKGKKKRERKINISRDDEPTRWASNQFRSCTRRICASLTRETEKKRPLRALLFLLPLLLLFLFLLLLLSLSLSRNWSWNRFQAG